MSQLSPFIQLMAAVYITMCLSNDLFRSFWTPNAFLRFEEALDTACTDRSHQGYIKTRLADEVRKHIDAMSSVPMHIGTYMLTLSVSLLIACGFEGVACFRLYFAVVMVCASALLIWTFHRYTMTDGKRLATTTLATAAIFVFSYNRLYDWVVLHGFMPALTVDTWCKWLVVAALLPPILYQLLHNWAHSTVYQQYILYSLRREFACYDAVTSRAGTANKESIPQRYRDAIVERFLYDEEEDLTRFVKVLQHSVIGNADPNVFQLLHFHFFRKSKEMDGTVSTMPIKVVGTIDLSTLNQSARPQKKKAQKGRVVAASPQVDISTTTR